MASAAGAPAASQTPGWLAPSVIVSLITGGVNLYFNVYGPKSARKMRERDFRRAEFDRMAANAIEAALTEVEKLGSELRALRARTKNEVDSAENRAARIKDIEALQTALGNPAIEAIAVALQKAQGFFAGTDMAKTVNWLSLTDLTDGILEGFDALCRQNLGPVEIQAAFEEQLGSITKTCMDIRANVSKVNHRLLGFKPHR